MNNREIVEALAAMSSDQVKTLVEAADATRTATALLEGLAPAKGKRKKRGPNKTKAAPVVAEVEAPAVKRGRSKKDPKPLASALERLKAQKTPGLKTRLVRPAEDED